MQMLAGRPNAPGLDGLPPTIRRGGGGACARPVVSLVPVSAAGGAAAATRESHARLAHFRAESDGRRTCVNNTMTNEASQR